MDEHGWRGHGSPSQPDTGIAQVLAYYARYGGELLGARRSDNPLTLTHVRWHDQSGHVFDAIHSPEVDGDVDAAEREVWVQLALDLPVAAAGMFGPQAPWERLALDQDRAAEMLNQLRRSLASRPSHNNHQAHWSPSAPPPQPVQQANQPYPPNRPAYNPGYNPGFGQGPNAGWYSSQPTAPVGRFPAAYQPVPPAQQPPQPQQAQQAPQAPPAQQPAAPHGLQSSQGAGAPGSPLAPAYAPRTTGEPSAQRVPHGGPEGSQAADPARQWTNSMRVPSEPEVVVIPCIEVELPPVLTDPAASDQARDFTRDVARHFNRSARQLQQVRETRGWMRNGRMVLAARMAVAPGSRVPSHMEMENAARLLGDTLARNMLPFTRMTFAEPGEWTQGIGLPE